MKYIKYYENWWGNNEKEYETDTTHKNLFLTDIEYTLNWVLKHNPKMKIDNVEQDIDNINIWHDYNDEETLEQNIERFKEQQIESFKSCIKEYIGLYNKAKKENKMNIYRQIKINDLKDLNLDSIGIYWSYISYLDPYSSMTTFGNGNINILIEAETEFKNINWENSLENFIYYGSSENEIKLYKKSKIKILDIKLISTDFGSYKNGMFYLHKDNKPIDIQTKEDINKKILFDINNINKNLKPYYLT